MTFAYVTDCELGCKDLCRSHYDIPSEDYDECVEECLFVCGDDDDSLLGGDDYEEE